MAIRSLIGIAVVTAALAALFAVIRIRIGPYNPAVTELGDFSETNDPETVDSKLPRQERD